MGFFGNVSYQLAKCFDTISFKNTIPSAYVKTTAEDNIRYQNLTNTGEQFIAETEKDEIGIRTGDKWINCKKYQVQNNNIWTTNGLTFFHSIPNPTTWNDPNVSTNPPSLLNKVGGIDVISSGDTENYVARVETDTESIQLGFGDFITLFKPVFDEAGHASNVDIQKYYLPNSPNLQTVEEVTRLMYHLGGNTPLAELIKMFLYLTFKGDNRQIINWVKSHILIDGQPPSDELLASSGWLVTNLSNDFISTLPIYSIQELCEHINALENISLDGNGSGEGGESGNEQENSLIGTNFYTYLNQFQQDIVDLQNSTNEYLEMEKAIPYVGYILDFYQYLTAIKTTVSFEWLKNTFILQDIKENSLNTFHYTISNDIDGYINGTNKSILLTNNNLLSTANNMNTTVFVNTDHQNAFQSAFSQFDSLNTPAPIVLLVYNISGQEFLGTYQSTTSLIYSNNSNDYVPTDIYVLLKIKLTQSSIYRRFKLNKQQV